GVDTRRLRGQGVGASCQHEPIRHRKAGPCQIAEVCAFAARERYSAAVDLGEVDRQRRRAVHDGQTTRLSTALGFESVLALDPRSVGDGRGPGHGFNVDVAEFQPLYQCKTDSRSASEIYCCLAFPLAGLFEEM